MNVQPLVDKPQGDQVAQIIVHHIEKLYGEPNTIEDYNIVVTDGTAKTGINVLSFLADKAFTQINAIEKDPQLFEQLHANINMVDSSRLNIWANADYVDSLHLIVQDVVVITPVWDDSYQMMREEELTLSGYPLSDLIRILFTHDRLTSLIVFILPLRYNTNTLSRYNPTWYQLRDVLISVIEKTNLYS